jgi:hypothetical protein
LEVALFHGKVSMVVPAKEHQCIANQGHYRDVVLCQVLEKSIVRPRNKGEELL